MISPETGISVVVARAVRKGKGEDTLFSAIINITIVITLLNY